MDIAAVERSMRLLREMERLLVEERRALEEGDLRRVEEALAEKRAVILRLEKIDRGGRGGKPVELASAMNELRARQEDNASLLRGMMERMVEEVAELRKRRTTLRAYAKGGAGDAAFLNGRA